MKSLLLIAFCFSLTELAVARPGKLDAAELNGVISENLQNEKNFRKNIQDSAGIDKDYSTGPSAELDRELRANLRQEPRDEVSVSSAEPVIPAVSRLPRKSKYKIKESTRIRISEEMDNSGF